ncbi:MAG: ABC transporter ATP-binding protein [Sphaerochaetaceae bacterium]
MSVDIDIKHAQKKYGKNTIIPDLSLNIKEGEFFTLLGPSGCGKTTLLRMIAGFNTIEGGEIFFGDRLINDLDPAKRNIGMVFQNYAIFPHLTVQQNVEFGLKARKYPPEKIKSETDRFLSLMQIEQYRDRLPERLSGGQQQRVALARALVILPDVLLMDEPLSNLDAKLRIEMRSVIKQIQNKLHITTVYVTHDQEEAMAVSDHIAVMNQGVIQQIGTPKQLYQRPHNLFVATFIGRSNILHADLSVENGTPMLRFNASYCIPMDHVPQENRNSQKVRVSIRPEEFCITAANEQGLDAVIEDSIFLGLNTHYFIALDSGEKVEIIKESTIDNIVGKGTRIKLTVNKEKTNLFTEDGNANLLLKTGEMAI